MRQEYVSEVKFLSISRRSSETVRDTTEVTNKEEVEYTVFD